MSNNPGNKAKYQAFYTCAKGKSPTALVVGNPGIPATKRLPPQRRRLAGHVTGRCGRGRALRRAMDQVARRPCDAAGVPDVVGAGVGNVSTCSHLRPLVYESPDDTTTRSICTTSSGRNAGWIYVTRDRRPDPWDTPPSDALIVSPHSVVARSRPWNDVRGGARRSR